MVEGEILRLALELELPTDEVLAPCRKVAHDVVKNEIRIRIARAKGCVLKRGEDNRNLIPFTGGAVIKNTSNVICWDFSSPVLGRL